MQAEIIQPLANLRPLMSYPATTMPPAGPPHNLANKTAWQAKFVNLRAHQLMATVPGLYREDAEGIAYLSIGEELAAGKCDGFTCQSVPRADVIEGCAAVVRRACSGGRKRRLKTTYKKAINALRADGHTFNVLLAMHRLKSC